MTHFPPAIAVAKYCVAMPPHYIATGFMQDGQIAWLKTRDEWIQRGRILIESTIPQEEWTQFSLTLLSTMYDLSEARLEMVISRSEDSH